MASYELLQFQLRAAPGRESQAAFMASLRETGAGQVRAAGGEVLGLFTPQLGWAASEMAVLVRWPDRGQADLSALAAVESGRRDRLTPTLRPRPTDALRLGGVHVLRWFHVRPDATDEFVRLSGEGWSDFETR